ncbi:hypothetical protein RFI_34627 [Reticulomyxa filosa]|uniref:Uncharacterized protein n=1 Tax=Reticulomyxa filosa TaxID=46433 RepID=X6LPW7_RETFI|nr:hypothetical protein RFI_34627 [Reticulomyxa filosa]|eukprot:ETO02785.1 hypothetical protein RFI_34627 [Reticulomyxa filosa]
MFLFLFYNEIQKIKQEMQVKEKQIIEQQKKFEEKNKQMNDNKEEQKENIIESDEVLEFESNKSTFKIPWLQYLPKTKTIKNALVMMIAIKLNYEFECNKSPQMTKTDVQSFLAELVVSHKLHKNTNKYDNNNLWTWNGKKYSSDK